MFILHFASSYILSLTTTTTMSSQTATVDKITKSLTFRTIPKITGAPTYVSIAAIHAKLKINAASIPTTLGGGQHGHLGLVLSPATYLIVANIAFDCPPANPGIHPHIPPGFTAAQIQEINRQHQAGVKTWKEYNNTDTALKNLLIQAIDDQFIKSLHNRNTGYVTSTTWHILDFLYTNYDNITPAELLANTERLQEPYNPSEPIESLFTHFEDAREYADAAYRPFTDKQILEYALLAILKTGQFKEAIREWRRLPEQTWNIFKTHFAYAHKEYCKLEAFSGNSRYTANNLIKEASTEILHLVNFGSSSLLLW
jgi:hypothetical protein